MQRRAEILDVDVGAKTLARILLADAPKTPDAALPVVEHDVCERREEDSSGQVELRSAKQVPTSKQAEHGEPWQQRDERWMSLDCEARQETGDEQQPGSAA